ncbi:UDP-2,3-diacylglucosamine diphosphatase [Aliidiomarina iranensis]|uniref:UDP-2,3-diacylglucosamine hydrolase n=1 Tax=Aliidiomarina iranensis TaxID=1434071 RepID=A0A432VWR6_9GAMM|nr:UDP-2,3-diacylglucosamine diphosphatase [Aliidiomarina iranensis]RUO21112.1 UDP-2,3-diacylglucosamine diphosphatase [Aliidiomarina iranensis]
MTTRFISDLHLSAERPDITGLFIQFLRSEARESDAVYILGDLVEYWIGDDDDNSFHRQIQTELKALTDSGVPCYFIHGNRDFLIGEQFAEKTGVIILPEPSVIDLYGRRTVILHGDTLCTDDVGYQRFRKIIRHPWLLAVARNMPLAWRRWLAEKLRDTSAGNKVLSAEELAKYDAKDKAVGQVLAEASADLMIHGHTHQPNIHQHMVNNSLKTRIVLGDWYEQGSILEIDAEHFELKSQPLAAAPN